MIRVNIRIVRRCTGLEIERFTMAPNVLPYFCAVPAGNSVNKTVII